MGTLAAFATGAYAQTNPFVIDGIVTDLANSENSPDGAALKMV